MPTLSLTLSNPQASRVTVALGKAWNLKDTQDPPVARDATQAEVKQYLETILYVSVNPEHGKAEAALFEKFEGRGFPTFLILAKNHPVQEIATHVTPEAFLQECNEAARGGSR